MKITNKIVSLIPLEEIEMGAETDLPALRSPHALQQRPLAIKCHCGNKGKIYDIDPYIQDLYPKEKQKPRWWCSTCYNNRLEDI